MQGQLLLSSGQAFQFLKDTLYEMIPGFAANLLAIYVVSLLTPKPGRETEEKNLSSISNQLDLKKIKKAC
ncbi:hypothetical protein GCM10020331_015270 [Ectobacillus funiculus]